MMTAPELIASLERLGVRLLPHDGSLRCQAPKGVLTREIREAIDGSKDEILALLQERERSQRLSNPSSLCVHEIFRSWAMRTPHAIALVAGGRELSYGELERRSNGLAHRLRTLGVATDVAVGICMGRSIEAVVGMLGVLKAGGAYLPLDPAYPQERLELMLKDAGAPVLLTDAGAPMALSSSAQVIGLRADRHEGTTEPNDEPPDVQVAPEHLAYVMYTSGSTGSPKGVEIRHRGITRLLFEVDYAALDRNQNFLHLSSTAFDASTFELWGALLHGARCEILPGAALSLAEIARAVAERRPTVLWLTASLYNAIVDEAPEALAPVRQLLIGGEALSVAHVKRGLQGLPETRIVNGYGPTENTTFTCCYPIPRRLAETVTSIPIGGPIGGTHVCILDPSLTPVPVGMQGELGVGGDGLARGYLRRPELTAEKFVPHPFSKRSGDRLYRTGDLCRWRADGTIEFLGRIDRQVKLRGFRIELSEIENALCQRPGIRAATVQLRRDLPQGAGLVAYVVADPGRQTTTGRDQRVKRERVEQWQRLYEDTYDQESPSSEADFNVVGWNSSYTGRPFSLEEMREWRECTLDRLLSLRPRDVLEIGCGTGLLLLPLAEHCRSYWGTDFSPKVLEQVGAAVRGRGLDRVKLDQRMADDFSGIAAGSLDLVVLNSIVQYFPDVDYLVEVLEGAVDAVASGGHVFIGDVRNLPLLDAFHASVQLQQATPLVSRLQLGHRVRQAVAREQELVLSPGFFVNLGCRLRRVRDVEVLLKRGRHFNELTCFRYDVVLHVGGEEGAALEVDWRDWDREKPDLPAVRELLSSGAGVLGLKGVRNARVAAAVRIRRLLVDRAGPENVGDLRSALSATAAEGVDPEDLWQLGEELGYQVRLSWAGASADGLYDAVFVRKQTAADSGPMSLGFPTDDGRSLRELANDPLQSTLLQELTPELRRALSTKIPDFMLPSVYVLMDALPLTPNGKIDTRLLPPPDSLRPDLEHAYLPPRTPAEARLARLWEEILGIEQIGVNDDFFELGGHSLLATQLVSRIREEFGVELPLRSLFGASTIASLAHLIPRSLSAAEAPPIRIVDRVKPLPVSFAQQRLWFLDQLVPGNPFYNIPAAVRIVGRLDLGALRHTFREIVARHESLRTTFDMVEGEPVQTISSAGDFPIAWIDLSQVNEDRREQLQRQLVATEAIRPFDLHRGPLLRVQVLHFDPTEHVVVLVMHHIVSDGWSLRVLLGEVAALYHSRTTGRPSSLAPLPVQYADFACWQREWLTGTVLDDQVSYWKGQLADLPVLELPTDRPRPPMPSFQGWRRSFVLGPGLSASLQALSSRAGATVFMTLLAAFEALLYRYTAQEDIVIGSPIAGRTRSEIEGLIGFFVNTLVLRTRLNGALSFRQLLARVRDCCLDAYGHQDVPFEKLVEELRPARDLGREALFQVMFDFINAPLPESQIPGGLSLIPVEVDNPTSKFDLTLLVSLTDAISGQMEYSTDLFEAATIGRMIGHLRNILGTIATDSNRRLAELELLNDEERQQLLVDWNRTVTEYPADASIHEIIADQSRGTPDRVALVFEGACLSYQQLDDEAERLAAHLRGLGVGPEETVGVCAERSPELVVGLLAVLKTGGAYLPLDPGEPAERLAFMMRDSAVPVVLSGPGAPASLADAGPKLVPLAIESSPAPGPSERASRPPLDKEHIAYVIYTSGSTGRPKGVRVPHAGIANRLLWMQQRFPLAGTNCVLQKTPFGFDVSVWELFWPLMVGARLVVARPEGHRDPGYLSRLMAEESVDTVHFVPSMLQVFLEERGFEDSPALERVISSGEALTPELERRFFEQTRKVGLFNLYGPTEASVDVTCWACRDGGSGRKVPIGKPIANTEIQVLDSWMEPVPVKIAGELCIGGMGLARDYYRRPELTAERFVPHPFGSRPGGRLYRTGDRVRYLEDGNIDFLGRVDHQVKIRGVRTEPAEIEAVLESHPSVARAAVIAGTDLHGELRLQAYLQPSDTDGTGDADGIDVSELRRFLKLHLPSAMVPSTFATLAELPLTPSGKIDRRKLASIEVVRPAPSHDLVPPRTPEEERLAQIWCEVLGLKEVGIHDDFFELGGHSLLATRMVSQVRDAFQTELPLRVAFESTTIATLAAAIHRESRRHTGPIVPTSRDEAIPLSFAQQRLWFLDQLAPEHAFYNVPVAVRLTGPLNVSALIRAFREIVRRHETLRTSFAAVDGTPVQRVVPSVDLRVPIVDLRGLSEEARRPETRRLASIEARHPFDLAHAPLLRVSVLKTGESDQVALLTMHHIVSDGWSMAVLVREAHLLYQAFSRGLRSPLEELPIQYADFARWQRQWLTDDVIGAQLDYWRRALRDLPSLNLPTDRPAPVVERFRGATFATPITSGLSRRLRAVSRQENVTPFMTLLAAFQTLLFRYTGQQDIVVGSAIANRNRGEIEGLIGFFVNTLVMRTDLSGDPTFRTLLGRVRDVALEAYTHQDLPFDRLVEELRPERKLMRQPLFQVMFAVQNAPLPTVEMPDGLRMEMLELDNETAKFDLEVHVIDQLDNLHALFMYNTDVFDEATIRRMSRRYLTLLESAVEDPEVPVSDLRIEDKPALPPILPSQIQVKE